MDAPLIGNETEFATVHDLEIREGDDGATVMRKFRASLAYAKAACREADEDESRVGIMVSACQERPEMQVTKARLAKALRVPSDKAIDRHAALAISAGYRAQDRR